MVSLKETTCPGNIFWRKDLERLWRDLAETRNSLDHAPHRIVRFLVSKNYSQACHSTSLIPIEETPHQTMTFGLWRGVG